MLQEQRERREHEYNSFYHLWVLTRIDISAFLFICDSSTENII